MLRDGRSRRMVQRVQPGGALVKWKMAPNSLFAILLRSPWWLSFAVVLGFALVSAAVLPQQYRVFGIMGSLPFLVIAVVAATRQLRAPSEAQVDRTLQAASILAWSHFSAALERAYVANGHVVTRLDGKVADLMLTKAGRRTLVCAKRWKAGNHGIEPLRALAAAARAEDTSHCIYVTLAEVGDKTQRFARENQIELLHGAALAQLLGKLVPA